MRREEAAANAACDRGAPVFRPCLQKCTPVIFIISISTFSSSYIISLCWADPHLRLRLNHESR